MGSPAPESPRIPSGTLGGLNWPRETGASLEFDVLRTQVAELQAALRAAHRDGESESASPPEPHGILESDSESDRESDRENQLLTELAAARQRFDSARSEAEDAWSALDEAEEQKAALEDRIESVRQELLALELQEAKIADEHEYLLSEFAECVQRQGKEAAALAAAQHAVGQLRRRHQASAVVPISEIAIRRTSERLWRSD